MNSRRMACHFVGPAAAVAFVLLGYVSNAVSAGACEVAVAHRVATPLGKDFFVLPESTSSPDTYPGSQAILRRAGFTPRRCSRAESVDGVCFPWAGVGHAKSVAPYVLEVDWGFVGEPLSGGGSHARVVAIFGFIVWQWNRGGWAV